MKLNFLVAGSYEVIDDVGGRSVSASAAEPLGAGKTSNDAAGVVDAAVSIKDQ